MLGFFGWIFEIGKSLLSAIGAAIGGVFRWAAEDLRNAVILALMALLVWSVWISQEIGAKRDQWQTTAGKFQTAAAKALDAAKAWKAAHAKLVADVLAQQKAAAEADKANVARVAREYAAINERTENDYQVRLDDSHAALEQLRGKLNRIAAAGDQGDGGRATVPAALTARCQAFGAADCDSLLAALPDQLAAAEDNTGKLIGLQDYVRSTLAIDFSGDGARAEPIAQAPQ